MATIDIRPADSRFHTDAGWLDSKHSFSFGPHHDPTNVGHGFLIVSNDDRVAPGAGFDTHGHRNMEIVTWVLDGELAHRDSAGNNGVLYPGLAQRMSAGSGIMHSEMNNRADAPVHFVQMWVVPDTAEVDPGYEQIDVNDALAAGGLVKVASGGDADHAVHLHQKEAEMFVGRLSAGESVELPAAPFVHVFVARGAATLDGHELVAGDAARLTDAGSPGLRSTTKSEVIVWAMQGQAA